MKILLSPAKLQRAYPGYSQGSLLFKKETKLLIQELKNWKVSDFAVRMKLSQDKATETFNQFQKWGKKAIKPMQLQPYLLISVKHSRP
jgi:cytoplasmic iron level regulating protein YaaA (DUF328/UPF0246 family)